MGSEQSSHKNRVYNILSSHRVTDGSGAWKNYLCPEYENQVELHKSKTWIKALNESIEKYTDSNCFGYRKATDASTFETSHTYLTYGEVSIYANRLAYSIQRLGLTSKKDYEYEGDLNCIGIYSRNCAEWFITDLACQRSSVTSVAFYTSLGDKSFEHIFNQTKVDTMFVSEDSIDTFILYFNKFNFSCLKNVVVFDLTLYSEVIMFEKLKQTGLNIISFKDLINEDSKEEKLVESSKDTIFTICYTSGSTNLPKGVKLTQNNFYNGLFAMLESGLPFNSETVHISYLPLTHIFERLGIHTMTSKGALVCFMAATDIKKYFFEDILLIRPTLMLAVPRVLTLFHQKIMAAFNEVKGCSRVLIEKAIEVKKQNFQKNGELNHSFYDSLVFKKVKDKFGGRLKGFFVGSAPVSKLMIEEISIFFSAPIVDSYGMTETTGPLFVAHRDDPFSFSVGGVLSVSQFKLSNCKDLEYNSETTLGGEPSPTGEICCKGLNVFSGYFLDREKTLEAFDEDGWLRTGDVGRLLPHSNGLKIIDRLKEIFKLSQGIYIAPSKLENCFIKSKYVIQICIYGDSLFNYLLAIIVPNKVELTNFLKEKGIFTEGEEIESYYSNKELHAEIKKDFDLIAKQNFFNPFERPLKFILSKNEFTVQNDLITPTMKLMRRKIKQFYSEEIKVCYSEEN